MKSRLIPVFLVFPFLVFSQTKHKKIKRVFTNQNIAIIEKNHLQQESTFLFEFDEGNQAFSLPATRLRLGINKDVEIFTDINFGYTKPSGFGLQPLSFGAKANMFNERKYCPAISILGEVQTKNWGSKNYRNENFLVPLLSFMIQKDFNDKFSDELDYSVQWFDGNANPSFIKDLFFNYNFNQIYSASIGITDFSTELQNNNFLFYGSVTDTFKDKNFTLSLEYGKYIENSIQNSYFSLGFTKNFNLKNNDKN